MLAALESIADDLHEIRKSKRAPAAPVGRSLLELVDELLVRFPARR